MLDPGPERPLFRVINESFLAANGLAPSVRRADHKLGVSRMRDEHTGFRDHRRTSWLATLDGTGGGMSEFVRFELDDGTWVAFEAAEADLVRQYGGDGEPVEGGALRARLAGAAATVQAIAQTMREHLSPDELTVELGLKVSGQANWFVGKAQSEGTVKVTAKWKDVGARPPEPE